MEDFKVEVVKINDILEHPNADRLEIAVIKGWNCVVGKGNFKKNDLAIYIPIDSILPEEIENLIFSNSKIKLHKHRVRTIKIRGVISQGLLVDFKTLNLKDCYIGKNVTKILGITKYEEPLNNKNLRQPGVTKKKNIDERFKKYTRISNFKNYSNLFDENDNVDVTEKIHGTNFRAGWLPEENFWKRLLNKILRRDNWKFVYGSHNVQLNNLFIKTSAKNKSKDFYMGKDVYARTVIKYDLMNKIPKGYIIYGEIYGDGIQKGYTYGCKKGETKLIVFDVMYDNKYLSVNRLTKFCQYNNLPRSFVLYRGKYDIEKIKKLNSGNSKMCPEQKIIEGVVIRTLDEKNSIVGRKILKLINDEYLLKKSNTDYH